METSEFEGNLQKDTMPGSINTLKELHDRYEHTSSVLDEKSNQATEKFSRKEVVAAWFTSMISCSTLLSTRRMFRERLFRERPCHKSCRHHDKPSHRTNLEVHFSTVDFYHTSQVSIAKLSAKKSLPVVPGEILDSSSIEGVLEKSSPTLKLYETLPPDSSIRLLRIYKGNPTDPVEFTLELAPLDDTTPEYEALSYVWGVDLPVAYIIHRSSQEAITVTHNLHEALKGVRHCDRDRLIWADALCINQKDGKEKGTQVGKMNSIYARASCVLVWLGPDYPGEADGAFGVLCALANETLQAQSQGNMNWAEVAHYTTRSRRHEPFIPGAVPSITKCELWTKVMRFFCQAWYTRLWVLQEIVLARAAVIVWGDCSIPWRYVGAAIDAIRQNPIIQLILETRNLQNAFFMWHLSNVHRNPERGDSSGANQQPTHDRAFPFLHFLDVARSFEVTDPRDKIYGLLGFPTEDDGFGPSSITPDYILTTVEVYTQMTLNFLQTDQNLNVLSFVLSMPQPFQQKGDHIDDLPSWVPNFNAKTTAFPISNLNIGHHYSAGFSRPMCLLPSSTSTRDQLKTSKTPSSSLRTLRLKGVELDTIRATGPATSFEQLYNMKNSFRRLLMFALDHGISLPMIAATLTAGRNKEGHLLCSEQKSKFFKSLMALLREDEHDWYRRFGIDLSAFPTEGAATEDDDALEAKDALWRFVTYRKPFVTETGQFGLGPWGVEEGDAVAVLWGGQCPFVVSEAGGGQWTLKGECFVEGWMDEQAVKESFGEAEGTVFEFQ